MYIIKLISRPIPFHFTVIKLYLQLKLTEEPTPYNTVEHKELVQINKPTPLLQEATTQLILKRGQGYPYKYPLLTAIADITIYLQNNTT